MRSILFACTAAFMTLLAAPAVAAPSVGDSLPRLVLTGDDEGIMKRKGDDDVTYSRFDSKKHLATGRVYLITYMAGRRSAQKMGDKLKTVMLKRKPSAKYKPVNVMNLDDCTFGTCGFARGKFEDHLHEKPTVIHVLDEGGKGFRLWGGMAEGMKIMVVDHTGKIVHMARGPFTASSAEAVGAAVDAAVAQVP